MKKLIFIFITIALFFLTFSCSNSSREEKFVGRWQLIEYIDNLPRVDSELVAFQKAIEIQKRMILVLNDDKSYSRNLEQQSEFGKWSVSEDGVFFITQPNNGPEMKMPIESVTNDRLTLKIEENIPPTTKVITKLTFAKLN